jgi:hypothetical protein
LQLGTNELGVWATLTQQFLVRAYPGDPPSFEDNDPVGVAHRREAMGDHDSGAAGH